MYQVTGDKPKYPGRCVKCGSSSRPYDQVLLTGPTNSAGKKTFAVAHAECVGGTWSHKVRGDVYSGPSTAE